MPTADTTNSFATVTEADAYFLNELQRRQAWNNYSDDDKSSLLIKATSILLYQLDWIVEPDLEDLETEHKLACYEQAWACHLKDRQVEDKSRGVKSMKLDVLEIENDKTDRAGVIPSHVTYLLRNLITSSAGGANIPLERE